MALLLSGWSQIQIAGHTCDLFEPPTINPHGYTLIYLHGVHLAPLVNNAAFTQQFAERGLRVICPQSGPHWWVNRVCPDFDPAITPEGLVLQHVLPYLNTAFGAQPPRIGIFGTSMGGQGALRMAYKYPKQFPVAAAISPAIDFHVRWREGDPVLRQMYAEEEAARQDTALLYVFPLQWPQHVFLCCDPADERWYESSEKMQMKLSSMGIPHEHDLRSSAGGHGWDYYNHMAPVTVQFLADRLEKERLRIV